MEKNIGKAPAKRSTHIEVQGARTHNLKNIDVRIPLRKLTVITGVSGSGKSSLAFDTLYAEGQRRYVESMSTYARQFIEKMARPDVDHVRNIQPAIAIEQKNSVKNARSTIGTATEISDYLRLIYAKAGVTICPEDGTQVREDTAQSVAEELVLSHSGRRCYIVAPVDKSTSVADEMLRQELMRAGFARLYVGNIPGFDVAFIDLNDASAEDLARASHESKLRVLIDRAAISDEDHERLASSVAVAFQAGHETIEIFFADDVKPNCITFHTGFRCNTCGKEFPRPEPNLFSFNSPLGACSECSGFGRVTGIDWDKVLPDRTLTLADKPIAPFNTPKYRKNYKWLYKDMEKAGVPIDVPLETLDKKQFQVLCEGSGKIDGIKQFFGWLAEDLYKVQNRIIIARYRGYTTCPRCEGTRLVPDARNVFWGTEDGTLPSRHIGDCSLSSIRNLLAQFESAKLSVHEEQLFGQLFRAVLSRLRYLGRVGLGYLTLNRQTRTLSGGEAQRINLSTALGTLLTQTLYVLDEPTVGLHPRDSLRLLEIMRALRDNGNTIVVVEHDPEIIRGADEIVDIGPRAGSHGGQVIFAGSVEELMRNGNASVTAKYLKPGGAGGDCGASVKIKKKRTGKSAVAKHEGAAIGIVGAREHNLKSVDAIIPLHKWVCVTGVSGSGKSTLIHNVLYQGFNQFRHLPSEDVGAFKRLDGLEQLDEIVLIDQSPLGRSIRSNPVTYVKAYDVIRKLFASTRESRALGLTDGSFSFNVVGGRCERCEGTGVVTYDMHFLAEMTLPCDVCDGRRFQPRVLEIRYRDKNVHDVLSMTIDDATEFFSGERTLVRRLQPLRDVGLGYLTLGQNTATLSGGEAQRLKLASYLTSTADGSRTMMVFDEPTTGLHLADLDVLCGVFRQLVERNFSLVIIEHNIEIIRRADWIVDLGPEGGDEGGELVVQGPVAVVAACERSHTGRFLW